MYLRIQSNNIIDGAISTLKISEVYSKTMNKVINGDIILLDDIILLRDGIAYRLKNSKRAKATFTFDSISIENGFKRLGLNEGTTEFEEKVNEIIGGV